MHPPAIASMQRKQTQGMSYREALRCLKRLIARPVFKTMSRTEKAAAGTVIQADFGSAPVALAV